MTEEPLLPFKEGTLEFFLAESASKYVARENQKAGADIQRSVGLNTSGFSQVYYSEAEIRALADYVKFSTDPWVKNAMLVEYQPKYFFEETR